MIQRKLPFAAKSFFASDYITLNKNDIILLFHTEEEAIKAYKQSLFFTNDIENLYFPSLDTLPYEHTSPNQNILSERAAILTKLATSSHKKLLFTNAQNLLYKLPPKELFIKSSLTIFPKMQLTAQSLADFLVQNSFVRNTSAIDSGEFAIRGEIIDIILPGPIGYRINFSWNQVDSIKEFNIDSQISTKICNFVTINAASEVMFSPETINNFKNNYLRNFGINHINIPVYEAIMNSRKFPGYENLLPLFYDSLCNFIDYMDNPILVYDNLSFQSILEYENSYNDYYKSRIESNKIKLNSFYPILPPAQKYFTSIFIKDLLESNSNVFIQPENTSDISLLENIATTSFVEKKTVFDKTFELFKKYNNKIIIIFGTSISSLERIKNIMTHYSYQYSEITQIQNAKINIVNLAICPLSQSFYTDKYLFISTQDILGEKSTNASSSNSARKLKNILLELDNLSEGELVVHKDHGIGQFAKIEILDVNDKAHDFLKIIYANNDKLYIPVENIDLIKKYGANEVELDKLGSKTWQKNKAKLKNRIQEIALQLLEMAAKRKLAITEQSDFNLEEYNKFCDRFPYAETEDQLRSINDVRSDLNSGILMDRLICGDVGFGKTEVAMRAAFMVAKSAYSEEESPQVAIVVPTTILCKQHYSRFLERFKGFDVNIQQLSSLVSASSAKLVKEQIKNGEINIIIGTHSLLHRNIKFNNLKLLIIDEEQHFGVAQKEYLKELKSSVHILSMSATPIPRTLQMSMTGLKELSIIATAPMDRLEVRTTITPFDPVVLRDALLREHFRGGRSFYVSPRINDIPEIEKHLQQIVPELKYKIAHGKMSSAQIDDIMTEFYEGKFDILISTTIIESGIDVAEANTMIIHKAEMLGLSQLYQLRGRIGRGKVRGYAYLTLPNYKKMTKHALQRLEIIQNSCSLGSGFTIASHDMDLRGFGNLVGSEQSGQIKEVGVELYQEMLEEQIAVFKNEPLATAKEFVPTINIGLAIFIPDNYLADSTLKLALYRRIGNIATNLEVENFRDEMIDRFGPIPIEFSNLLEIVKIKLLCLKLNIENLDGGEKGFVIKFAKESGMADKIMKFMSHHSSNTKIKPDNKLVFIKKIPEPMIVQETYNILEELLII